MRLSLMPKAGGDLVEGPADYGWTSSHKNHTRQVRPDCRHAFGDHGVCRHLHPETMWRGYRLGRIQKLGGATNPASPPLGAFHHVFPLGVLSGISEPCHDFSED